MIHVIPESPQDLSGFLLMQKFMRFPLARE